MISFNIQCCRKLRIFEIIVKLTSRM